MSSRDVLDVMVDLEGRFPVQGWRLHGIDVWPVLRVSLSIQLLHEDRRKNLSAPDGLVPRALHHLRRGGRRIRRTADVTSAALADRLHNQNLDRDYPAAVLMASSHRRVRMGSGWYAIYSDPIVDLYRSMGVASLVLERGVNGYRIPRYSPSLLVSPRPPWSLERPGRQHPSDRSPILEDALDQYEEMVAWLRRSRGISPPKAFVLGQIMRDIRRRAEFFRRVLARVGTRVGFTVCYYNSDGFAFNLACRELGIPTVDVQHGVQGHLHFAYGQWTHVPVDGYGVLPDYFWCWTEADAEAIRVWSRGTGTHRPIAGGNLWLDVWREHGSDLGRFTLADVQRIRGRGGVHVLYTCDRNPVLPPALIEAIRLTPVSWVWWVRLHPGMNEAERRQVEEQLRQCDGATIEIETATAAPLLQLLGAVDVHATRYSTVVLEAESAGIGSILMDPIGEEYYERQVASGSAQAAYGGEEVIRAAERFRILRDPADSSRPDEQSGRAAVRLRRFLETGVLSESS